MIWRVFVLFDLLTIGSYVCSDHGVAAAWAVVGAFMAILLPFSKAVSHLAKIEELHTQQLALLSKILKGYVR